MTSHNTNNYTENLLPLSYNIAFLTNLYADYFPSPGSLQTVSEVGISRAIPPLQESGYNHTPGNMQHSKLMQTLSSESDLIAPHIDCWF